MNEMRVINVNVRVGDFVAFPTQRHNKGLAMQIGEVTELRPEKECIQVRIVYSPQTHPGVAHKEVRAELCARIDSWDKEG